MKHYSIEQWVDYTRGLVPEPLRSQMAGHLSGDCAQCRRLVQRLQATAPALAEIEVPEALLERARAIFPVTVPDAMPWPVRALTALLRFDSLSAPLPQGVRSAAPTVRRLAYTVEDFSIELMLDANKPKRTVIVTGQISTRPAETAAPRHRIRLMSRNDTLLQVEASEFGEFQFEFRPAPKLRLVVLDAAANRQIEVPLAAMEGVRRADNSPRNRKQSDSSEEV